MQLQAAMDPQDESLIVNCTWDEPLHSLVSGVWDPNASSRSRLITNRLYVQYVFQDQFHWLLQESTDPLILPLEDHHEEEHVEYDQTDDLSNTSTEYLPQFDRDLDGNGNFFSDLCLLWDEQHQYMYNDSEYLSLRTHRPEGFFIMPRQVAVARALVVAHNHETRRVLVAIGASALVSAAIAAAHVSGIVDLSSVPILSWFFSKHPTTATTTTTPATSPTPAIENDSQSNPTI